MFTTNGQIDLKRTRKPKHHLIMTYIKQNNSQTITFSQTLTQSSNAQTVFCAMFQRLMNGTKLFV